MSEASRYKTVIRVAPALLLQRSDKLSTLSSYGRQVASQEQRLKEAQRDLDRIRRMYDEMERRVLEEQRKLADMSGEATDFASFPEILPALSDRGPGNLRSQYDQFGSTPGLEKIGAGGTQGVLDSGNNIVPKPPMLRSKASQGTSGTAALGAEPGGAKAGQGGSASQVVPGASGLPSLNFAGKLQPVEDNTQMLPDQHWNEISEYPGQTVYVSGRYRTSSGVHPKSYEYSLEPTAYSPGNPIRIGDVVKAPVHLVGYHTGQTRNGAEHDLDYIIDDIYTKATFHRYSHDRITKR